MSIKDRVKGELDSGQMIVWIRRITAILMLTSVLYTLYTAWSSELMPSKYLIPVAVGVIIISLGSAIFLWKKKLNTAMTLLSILLASLILVGSYFAYSIVSAADNFISSVTHSSSVRYETYGVVAMKESEIDFYDSVSYQLGVNSMDTYLDILKEELGKKSEAEIVDAENLTQLTNFLLDGQMEAITVNLSHLEIINDNFPDFDDRTHIIHTFKIKIEGEEPRSAVDGRSPFVVYISGIDTYGSINTSSRSDVNMLAVINPVTSHILLVNTPRDYFVELAGANGARDKLTHAGIYGIETSEATLENLYGIEIDRHLKVNFTTLVNVVDAIGGITVKSDYPFKSFTVGDNYLNGRQALEFSRERYSFERGDIQRGRNQQRVIEGIVSKLSDPQTLLSYQDILISLQGSLQSNVEPVAIKNIINTQLSDMNSWSVESIGVEGTGGQDFTYSMGDLLLYVMHPDENSVYEAKEAIARTLGV